MRTHPSRPGLCAWVGAALVASTAAAQEPGGGEGPGRDQFLAAARSPSAIALDGRLDEPAWAAATPFDGLVQVFPTEGAAPSQRTTVSVLFDEHTLYVGVRCDDTEPGLIVASLGRRDTPPPSDTVQVVIDSSHDHRTAMSFSLTAGGVQQDGLFFDDDRFTPDWDELWAGQTSVDAGGWSAEFALPLSMFRFSEAPAQTWGFGVRREVGRTHDVFQTVLIPRNARGVVSRLGHLTGVDARPPSVRVELTPYLATRATLRPQFSFDARPDPRLLDPAADLGLDVRARLGATMVLNAALNPDFGQVEADQILLNLSTFEIFRPEKRAFFNQGLDLFQPVGAGQDQQQPVPQQLFYSRRVGLDTPILAALKLTGKIGEKLQIGLLDTYTDGNALPPGSREDAPDRSLRVTAHQPLHLGPVDEAPLREPVPQNVFAGVLHWEPVDKVALGLTVTDASPFGPRCVESEWELSTEPSSEDVDGPFRPRRCSRRSGSAAAVDWNLRTRDSAWGLYGQLAGSESRGGPPVRTLADGTTLRAGDRGVGGYLVGGKLGGDPWRFDLRYEYASPRLELNAVGFQRTQNEQAGQASLRWVQPNGIGPFNDLGVALIGRTQWTTDGRGLNRGNSVSLGAGGLLKDPYLGVGLEAGLNDPGWDVRELGSGVALERPRSWYVGGGIDTEATRAVALGLWTWGGRTLALGPVVGMPFAGVDFKLTVRPHPRTETILQGNYAYEGGALKYVDERPGVAGAPYQYLLANLRSPTLSLTLRELVVLTPKLTLQGWAQLFVAFVEDGPFWRAGSDGPAIGPGALTPTTLVADGWAPSYDGHQTELNVNVVLRWEYRLGSLIYVVVSHAQHEGQPETPYTGPRSIAPHALWSGPATDTLLVKWSYRWET